MKYFSTLQKISVIIPNYNYAQFLEERIDSILTQTVTPEEIIFLDDNSSDASVALAREKLLSSGVSYKIFKNNENQGTYKQWLNGVVQADGNYIWIAEADDSCEPDFLEQLLRAFSDSKTVLAYCQSLVIDEKGEVVRSRNLHHTDALSQSRWLNDYHETGLREVVDYLVYRNTIPNVSACLFRAKALKEAIKGIEKFQFDGDFGFQTFSQTV